MGWEFTVVYQWPTNSEEAYTTNLVLSLPPFDEVDLIWTFKCQGRSYSTVSEISIGTKPEVFDVYD